MGAFLSPRNISPQIFSEIFSNQTKATFFYFFGAKNYEGRYCGFSGNRGGVSLLLVALPYSNRLFFAPGSWLPESGCLPAFIVANFQSNRSKQGKNEFLFGGRWCFLGIFGDNNGQKPNIFLKVGAVGAVQVVGFLAAFVVSTCAGGQAFGGCVLLSWCVPSFCPLFCFALGALSLKYGLFRVFGGVFSGF